MGSDLKSTRLAASGSVFGGPGRVRALTWVASATAGSIQIRDGGAGGTVICTIDTPASATASDNITLPDSGMRCEQSIYVTLTNVSNVTVWYA